MTKTFRKDTERCRKRGTTWNCSRRQFVYLKSVANCPNHIVPTSCLATMADVGNVT